MQLLSEHLRRNPGHAVASDDKKNGFNSISREAIFAGLRRWYPELIPTVALWYKVPRRLFLFNEEARDGDGNVFMSSEGCAQGDPLGPFLFAIGYHWTLLEMQVRNPSNRATYARELLSLDGHFAHFFIWGRVTTVWGRVTWPAARPRRLPSATTRRSVDHANVNA